MSTSRSILLLGTKASNSTEPGASRDRKHKVGVRVIAANTSSPWFHDPSILAIAIQHHIKACLPQLFAVKLVIWSCGILRQWNKHSINPCISKLAKALQAGEANLYIEYGLIPVPFLLN